MATTWWLSWNPRHCHDLFVGQVTDRLDTVLTRYAANEPHSLEDFV